MSTKPILFSTPMVQAILDGRKTMTRRVIKPQPTYWDDGERVYDKDSIVGPELYNPIRVDKDGEQYPGKEVYGIYSDDGEYGCKAPCQPGDVLYVRETFAQIRCIETGNVYTFYAANELDYYTVMTTYQCDDNGFENDRHIPWRNGIHMPREAARLFLRVTDVRVERVQDITLKDIEQEGLYCDPEYSDPARLGHYAYEPGMRIHFTKLWNARNAKRGYGWDDNPWVWVYTFERITKEEAEHGR